MRERTRLLGWSSLWEAGLDSSVGRGGGGGGRGVGQRRGSRNLEAAGPDAPRQSMVRWLSFSVGAERRHGTHALER